MNRTFLHGNLTKDPELRHTQGGTAVLNFRMATNERVKEGEEWKDHAEFHQIVVWGKRGEALADILVKGSGVVIEGNIRTREWDDKEGNRRWSTEIHAREIGLTGGARGERSDDRGRDRRDDRDRGRRDDRRGRDRDRGRGSDRGRGRRDERDEDFR